MAYDFGPMLAKIKPLISAADLAICHIETPMSPDDAHLSGYPLFNSPHELATAIADAGYDGCSTASNHSVDQGAAGVNATLVALDRAGLQHAGTARSAAEAAHVELHDVRGVEIAHLSYTYGTNGNTVAAGMPWIVNVTSVPRILADAHQARLAGASFVVVSMHWGSEYQTSPTAEQRSQAAALLASPDVDLILGDHVHVLQPVERIGGKYVIYGLGNVFSNQSPAAGLPVNTQDGAILKIHVTQQGSALVPDTVTFHPDVLPDRSVPGVAGRRGVERPHHPRHPPAPAPCVLAPDRHRGAFPAGPRRRRHAGHASGRLSPARLRA